MARPGALPLALGLILALLTAQTNSVSCVVCNAHIQVISCKMPQFSLTNRALHSPRSNS